jgi:hypothetical protein
MKLIIDVPEEVYEALKGIAEDTISLDPYSLADIIVNKSKPYGDRTKGKWIPVTYRPMTEEEEKEFCVKWDIKEGSLEDWEKRVFTCPLPEDGQEILISTHWGVSEDVCTWDDDCVGLEDRGDWDGVDAWMPKPEPYKKGGAENGKI